MVDLGLPATGLVLLVGVSGSGKSSFAARHFLATEVVSSDVCRGLVSNDGSDQSATADAFDLLHHLVGIRLRRGLLTVVDATNVQRGARASLIEVAKAHDSLIDAIVLDVDPDLAAERNEQRPDRDFGSHVVRRQHRDLQKSLRRLSKEGFRRVHTLRGVDEIDAASIHRQKPWNDRSELTGPFDVIGDVHGCVSELRTLLVRLGWQLITDAEDRPVDATHPNGRTAVFVGDLVDRGPDTPGVLRLVMGMVASGNALSVSGNHEAKLVRALRGANVQRKHGLATSMEQLAAEPAEFTAAATDFMAGLISHYVLDRGNLVVAHAGLKEAYHGRTSGRVRAFAMYGDTTGEIDEFGLPVRLPWADEYRGKAMVVHGHTPIPEAVWVNNTICLDTGAVFGGELTALRYPERELVAVPAEQQWSEPVRPLAATASPEREPTALAITDVLGERWLTSPRSGRVKIPAENAAAALEVMSRYAVDPRWLIHLPATMAPAPTSRLDGFLEHPATAFEHYAAAGVAEVVCEEKHMGSRAIAVLAADAAAAERRFGVGDGSIGVVHTRTGRTFFGAGSGLEQRLRAAVAPMFEELQTDWLLLDAELLPWSAKASELIKNTYARVGAAAAAALPAVDDVLRQVTERGGDVAKLLQRNTSRAANAAAYRDAYARYIRPVDGLDGVTMAPFSILAAEGRVPVASQDRRWQLQRLGALDDPFLTPTRHRFVRLDSAEDRSAATDWWTALTAAGGEGMVVKPVLPSAEALPGLKVRGREYLRIIYGPDYTDDLDRLRDRQLGKKRALAMREHRLGLDSLEGFVGGQPLWWVHQRAFAVLALESEAIDPRL